MTNSDYFKSESYWDNACLFFSDSGYINLEGSYFIHKKRSKTVIIGVMCQKNITVKAECLTYTSDDKTECVDLNSDVPIFKHIEQYVDAEAPSFFIMSPDIVGRYSDKRLPHIIVTQPMLQFTFSIDDIYGHVSYAKNSTAMHQGSAMLEKWMKVSIPPQSSNPSILFSDIANKWIALEKDEAFVKRLAGGIRLLSAYPDGKMTLTRSYQYQLDNQHNPFELYELQARENGDYACSHFFCIRENCFSLGCSPENVFEISSESLMLDVVAGTCKSTRFNKHVEQELTNNSKQIREHMASLYSRPKRYEKFCANGSLKVVSLLNVKRLRNVFHLHSEISGVLLPHVSMFDIIERLLPLLSARPKELLAFYKNSEVGPHRYYSGIVGHAQDNASSCFLNIRNALIIDNIIYAKVGVGLISESDAYSELLETQNKISGLMEAVLLWDKGKR